MSTHFRSRRSPARLKPSGLFGLAAVFALLAALLYAAVLAAPAGARRQSGPSRRAFAKHLLKLDPGRPLGGDTIVGVSGGDLLLGSPNHVNFMMALGSGERIVGGNRANELGALGKNATIKGGAGDDAIYGGPGHDTIFAGAGNDLIADKKGSATIHTGTGKNEVDVTGHTGRDRVLCAPGSVDRIYANRGDSIAPSCRKAAGSQVLYHQPAPIAADSAHVALSANGCTDNPDVDCAFVAAAGGPLKGLWWSQKTPARRCPPSHPYLRNEQMVHGTIGVVPGVNVAEIPQVDFFAGLVLLNNTGNVIGVDVGEVTNWTISSQDWHMWLYCTSDPNRGYTCANNACL